MDVQLYVYDLSQGVARQMSQQFLGTQIDAVYHTSIVLESIEYFFGQGIQTCQAGASHHGRPMEVVQLGRTELPLELVLDFVDSLKRVYTAESYDLFLHNCNNFSNDFSMFLVGKKIPGHITSLPQTVLSTPFGQMLRPMLDQSMRRITQAPVPSAASIPRQGASASGGGTVRNIQQLLELQAALESARKSFAVVFFTSSTCAPCKILYPIYDQLAREVGDQGVLIKVDINFAQQIARQYQVSATPTIIAFLSGEKYETWAGADVNRLKNTVETLVRLAKPRHPHAAFSSSALADSAAKPVQYGKIPPLDKLIPKLGSMSTEPIVASMKKFILGLNSAQKQENPLPSLPQFGVFLQSCVKSLPTESLFAAYDLLRVSLSDVRVSAFFLEPNNIDTVDILISHVISTLGEKAPYNLRIVTLQLTCNLVANDMAKHVLFAGAGGNTSSGAAASTQHLINLVTSNLLDASHPPARVAAAGLAFDLAALNYKHRTSTKDFSDGLSADSQLELVAALTEAFGNDEISGEALTGVTLALGLLLHLAPVDGEVVELGKTLDLGKIVKGKKGVVLKGQDGNLALQEAVTFLVESLGA